MADLTDDASDREQEERDRAIAALRRAAKTLNTSHTPGECANGCGAAPREHSIWCSKDCADDHEHRARLLKRQGVR